MRIRGIDTPEIKGKCELEKELAKKAKEIVEERIPIGSTIILYNVSRDKYFRIDATIILADGSYLDKVLIDNKLAYPYMGETKKSWCTDVIPVTDLFK